MYYNQVDQTKNAHSLWLSQELHNIAADIKHLWTLKFLGWCGSVEITGNTIAWASGIPFDKAIITYVNSKLIDMFDCGFVLWSQW